MRPYRDLVGAICKAVRNTSTRIPNFDNGAIRIMILPGTEEADDWLGGLSKFGGRLFNPIIGVGIGKDDICTYEFSFTISPDGDYVMTGTWDEIEQQVDCRAYSALKIADCARSKAECRGMISGLVKDDIYRREDNGFSPEKGAIALDVYSTRLRFFCEVFVSVSGASADEDLMCARSAIPVVTKFFMNEFSRHEGFVKTPD